MTRFLSGPALWKTLQNLAKKSSGRRLVAAPYVGQRAAKLLPLGKGDALLCALTLPNARAGSVVPSELRKLKKRGVKLFTSRDLHAKVYLFGTKAVVCSANLSHNSRDARDEAGVLVTERDEVAAIRAWFETRLAQPVQPEWLAKCAKAYRPARGTRQGGTGQEGQGTAYAGPWIISTTPDDLERPEEEKLLRAVEREAKRRLKSPKASDLQRIRWAGNHSHFVREAAVGDTVIQVCTEADGVRVYPHGTILSVRRGKGIRGVPVTFLAIEAPKRFATIARKRLDKAIRKEGLTPRRRGGRITDRDLASAMLRLTSPDKLRR